MVASYIFFFFSGSVSDQVTVRLCDDPVLCVIDLDCAAAALAFTCVCPVPDSCPVELSELIAAAVDIFVTGNMTLHVD